ncbi:precorrin-6Y C5,15-methyltransferase (decarboxylating) [Candidatus Magnetomoraceae bacterium gMMP-15]
MKHVLIIGMGLSPKDLTENYLKLIKAADILIGGKRHLEFFSDFPAEQKEITKDLKGLISYIKTKMRKKRIVVLASGDPMFFGIGQMLIKSIGKDNVSIHPNISSVAAAFSRIKESWQDVFIISMHGRNRQTELLRAIKHNDKIAVFTDPKNNPSQLAKLLLKKDTDDFDLYVFEQMGTENEKVKCYTLSEAASSQFKEPNLVVLKRIKNFTSKKTKLYLGTSDNMFDHHKGLITKSEIRAVTISKLCLSTNHILWDLGAGSGSVAIEASLMIKKGRIFAVEQHAERIKQIENNKKRFNVTNLKIIQSVLPDGLEALPEPDRIFIGGGGRNLEKIIRISSKYLKPGGIIVINTVLISNIEIALNTLKKMDYKTDIVQIQINRRQKMPWGERLEAQNPVWIISGRLSDSIINIHLD